MSGLGVGLPRSPPALRRGIYREQLGTRRVGRGQQSDAGWGVALDIRFPDNVMLLQTRPIKNLKEKKDPTDRIIDLLTRGMTVGR